MRRFFVLMALAMIGFRHGSGLAPELPELVVEEEANWLSPELEPDLDVQFQPPPEALDPSPPEAVRSSSFRERVTRRIRRLLSSRS